MKEKNSSTLLLLIRGKKGLNKRERSRAKRLQTIRKKAFVHTFDYGFFSSAINILQTLVVAIGAGLRCLGRNQPDGRLWKRQPTGANAHVR